jgi:hypothetical protein
VDDCCGSVNFVAVGIYWWLYGWWTHSYPAGRCHHLRGDPSYSRTKGIVAIWTVAAEDEYVDDSVITTKVKSLLAEDDFLKSFQISVESFKGTIQLSGFVNSQKAVDKAGEIVRSGKGLESIKNNLIVK